MRWCAAGGMGAVPAQPSVPLGQGRGWGLRRERSPTACWQSTSASEALGGGSSAGCHRWGEGNEAGLAGGCVGGAHPSQFSSSWT